MDGTGACRLSAASGRYGQAGSDAVGEEFAAGRAEMDAVLAAKRHGFAAQGLFAVEICRPYLFPQYVLYLPPGGGGSDNQGIRKAIEPPENQPGNNVALADPVAAPPGRVEVISNGEDNLALVLP